MFSCLVTVTYSKAFIFLPGLLFFFCSLIVLLPDGWKCFLVYLEGKKRFNWATLTSAGLLWYYISKQLWCMQYCWITPGECFVSHLSAVDFEPAQKYYGKLENSCLVKVDKDQGFSTLLACEPLNWSNIMISPLYEIIQSPKPFHVLIAWCLYEELRQLLHSSWRQNQTKQNEEAKIILN